MKESASEKLKRHGLDIEFLAWLEGEEARVPDLDHIRKVKDVDFAAAIRAAEWLAQHFSEPELIAPHRPEAWQARYEVLQQFLHAALGSSLFYHALSVADGSGGTGEGDANITALQFLDRISRGHPPPPQAGSPAAFAREEGEALRRHGDVGADDADAGGRASRIFH